MIILCWRRCLCGPVSIVMIFPAMAMPAGISGQPSFARMPAGAMSLCISAVPDPTVARCLREYLYARLNVEIPGFRSRLPPASVRQVFNRARRFFEFVVAELGCCKIDRVDQA